jgi:hypothetical protein
MSALPKYPRLRASLIVKTLGVRGSVSSTKFQKVANRSCKNRKTSIFCTYRFKVLARPKISNS